MAWVIVAVAVRNWYHNLAAHPDQVWIELRGRRVAVMPSSCFAAYQQATDLNPGIAVAGIHLYGAGNFRGYAYFYPDGTPLAPAVSDAVNGAIYAG